MTNILKKTDRNDLLRLIDARKKQVEKALGTEISADVETIKARLLLEKGFEMSSKQITEMINHLESQKKELLSNLDNDKVTMKITMQEAELERKYEQQFSMLRQEYDRKREELSDWKTNKHRELQNKKKEEVDLLLNQYSAAVDAIIKEKAPSLLETIDNYKTLHEEVSHAEQSIIVEAKRRAQAMKQAQSRLQYMVSDAALEAQTELMKCTDADEAILLLDRIPSVSELISIVESPMGGVSALVRRMNPKFNVMLPSGNNDTSEETNDTPEEINEVDAEVIRCL